MACLFLRALHVFRVRDRFSLCPEAPPGGLRCFVRCQVGEALELDFLVFTAAIPLSAETLA